MPDMRELRQRTDIIESELDVVRGGAPRKRRVLLEHDAAVACRPDDRAAVHQHAAVGVVSHPSKSSNVYLPEPLAPTRAGNSAEQTSSVVSSGTAERLAGPLPLARAEICAGRARKALTSSSPPSARNVNESATPVLGIDG